MSYSYDNNGNVTARGSDTFAWDHENRLTSATIAGVTTTYTYNPSAGLRAGSDGLRMSRSSGGTTTTYVWDVARPLPMVLQETTGSNMSTYVYGLGRISVTDQAGAQTYFLADGLGSTVKLVDGGGASTGDYAYDVFGAVKTHTGSSTEFGFTGEQNDPTASSTCALVITTQQSGGSSRGTRPPRTRQSPDR